jgi:F-type H+-transporting ATPase subunit a
VSHPPEPPHLIQLWFYKDYDKLKSEGKNPYGDPVDDGTLMKGLTMPQVLHVGRLEKPVPLIGYAPWENHVYFGLGCLVLIVLALLLTRGVRRPIKEAMRKPTRAQVLVETLVDAFDNFVQGILGEKNGRVYLPYVGTLFLLILLLNLMGIVPTMRAPTAYILVTVSLALSTLLVVQFTAWVRLGPLTYLHHLAGSPQTPVQWVLSPLFLILEALSDFVIKPLSLSLRLMGNIFGKDILLGSFLFMGIALLGLIVPGADKFAGLPLSLPFYFLALLLSAIQALIFALLSTIYILLVLPHDHDHHDEGHAHH